MISASIANHVHLNAFAALEDDSNHASDDADTLVDQLNSWAHVVVAKKNESQKARRGKRYEPTGLFSA